MRAPVCRIVTASGAILLRRRGHVSISRDNK